MQSHKMSRETSRNSSEKARDSHMEQNEIFCEEIREFVHESRKSQTVYRNFEGYHERTVKCNDLTKLNDLVFLILSDGKDRASLTPDEFAEAHKLAELMGKKINNSCMKFKCSDIRFQVVWIFYFDYLGREMKAMPVFKVYKKKKGSEAFYIDISVFEYDSWDHFIMFCQFPVSFICIPRRGEYTFQNIDGGDLLDLEYICKNSQLREELYRNFRPFSQTVIQRQLHNVMPFVRVVTPFLNMAIIFTEMHAPHPGATIFVLFISVLGICLRILELKCGGNESQNALESTAADCSLVLLNDNGEKSPWKKCLSLLYGVVELPLRDKSWVVVMNLVSEITEVCKTLFVRVAGVKGDVSKVFLEFPSELLSQATEKNQIKGKESKESKKGLCSLEKNSCEKVFSELCPGLNAGMEILKDLIHLIGLQKFGFDLFDFRVYLLFKYTSADRKSFLQNLLKSNYTLEEDIFCQNITLHGNLIGIVIPFSFWSENLAIIVLRLDKLPEVNN